MLDQQNRYQIQIAYGYRYGESSGKHSNLVSQYLITPNSKILKNDCGLLLSLTQKKNFILANLKMLHFKWPLL